MDNKRMENDTKSKTLSWKTKEWKTKWKTNKNTYLQAK